MRIGEQIKALRIAKGLSQGELAARSKMAQSRVSMIEKASNATLTTLRRLAAALDCELNINLSPLGSRSNMDQHSMEKFLAGVTGIEQREQETKRAIRGIENKLLVARAIAQKLSDVLERGLSE
ncbi:MAG: helix-turn-helix transcriptional regulator [Candidatus Acidiferrales bacterium]